MSKYVDGSKEEYWSEFLAEVLFLLRFTKTEATQLSPFSAIHGFEPDIPSPIQLGEPVSCLEQLEEKLLRSPEEIIEYFTQIYD